MKKFLLILAAVAMTLTASAQQNNKALADSKVSDNWYIGAHAGVSTQTTHNSSWLKDLNPQAGLRVGRWLTPVFGLAGDLDLSFSNKTREGHNTHFNGITFNTIAKSDLFLLSTWNLNNLFCGYPGEPRSFEVIPVAGIGWAHLWQPGLNFGEEESDFFTTKFGIDFTYNFGSKKEWQLYVEPAIVYDIADGNSGDINHSELHGNKPLNLNINRSMFQVNVGVNYKFRNSNGTHNFAYVDLRDQAEIDGLNGKINDLRGELAAKDGEIARLQKALTDCENKPVPQPEVKVVRDPMQTNLMPKVIFRLDKYVVDASQVANVDMIANYMKKNPEAKVFIKGYASMEGELNHNIELSNNRAKAVYDMLVNKYKIDPSRLSWEGCGPTSEMSDVLEFNRVATFEDTTKK